MNRWHKVNLSDKYRRRVMWALVDGQGLVLGYALRDWAGFWQPYIQRGFVFNTQYISPDGAKAMIEAEIAKRDAAPAISALPGGFHKKDRDGIVEPSADPAGTFRAGNEVRG